MLVWVLFLFGLLFSVSSLATFLFKGVTGGICLASIISSSSCCGGLSLSILFFFFLGCPCSILLLASALLFCFSFFLFLIFSAIVASLSRSCLSSSLHAFISFSPSLVASLGRAQRLYSDLSFIIRWFLAFWISTLSPICLSNAFLWVLMMDIPNLTWPHSSSSASCWWSRWRSMWLEVLQPATSFWCSSPLSYTDLDVSPMYMYLLSFLFSSSISFLLGFLSCSLSASSLSCLSLQVIQ